MKALGYMHAHSVSHRDIKLSNVLVKKKINTNHLEVCLSDYSVTVKHTMADTFIGSKASLAPEILQ